jgi:hypothetical protein
MRDTGGIIEHINPAKLTAPIAAPEPEPTSSPATKTETPAPRKEPAVKRRPGAKKK